MYTDIDEKNRISIVEMTPAEARLLIDALTCYYHGTDKNESENREEKQTLSRLIGELIKLV